jgi:hypothetical protein
MTASTASPTILLAYSVLAKRQYAYAPDVRLVLAQLWPHLVLDGSDCINFGIIILEDCPRRVSVIITMMPSLRPRFRCGYIDTGNPAHDIDHGIPSHAYLDQGCSTHRSRLPRHRHKGYHLA